jgi:subtilisin family serine protease
MKKNLRSLFLGTSFAIAGLLCSGIANGQTVYKDYQDGRIWFQLKNDKAVHLTISENGEMKPDLNNMKLSSMPYLRDVFTAHSIKKLAQPFPKAYGSPLISTYELEFTDIHNVDKLINELEESGAVVYAEKMPLMHIELTPNDPQYATNMWYLPHINADQAWNVGLGSSSIVVATTDNAIQTNHPDLVNALWVNPGEIAGNNIDDDNNGIIDDINGADVADGDGNTMPLTNAWDHGTHVAGTTGAESNNNTGVASIGFGVSVMAVKVTRNSASSTSVTDGYSGIYYATNNGADIINCSWGGTGFSTTGQNAVNYATSNGSIVVAAAGNSNVDNDVTPHYPSSYSNAVSVAATSTNDSKASFSCYGANSIDISAPGVSIRSTVPTSTYANMQGTSMATPVVSGLLGLMKSLNPAMPNNDLLNCLYSTAVNIDPMQNAAHVGKMGAGRIDAFAAMNCVAATLSNPPNALFTANFTTITAGGTVTFTDQSTFGPTSWSWNFDNQSLGGVSPATAGTQGPHMVTYNNVGVYEVSLTVSNANGNDTETKTAYINVVTPGACNELNLDDNTFSSTASIHVGWSGAIYGAGAGGFVSGNNFRGDRAKAEYFPAAMVGSNTQFVEGVYVWIGDATNATSPTVNLNVWNATGGTPTGAPLGTRTLNLADINPSTIYFWRFNTPIALPASSEIAVGFDVSNLNINAGDSLSIVTNQNGQPSTTIGFEQLTSNAWQPYSSGWTGITNLSHYIFPQLTANPATAVLGASATTICEGDLVNYDATGSTYGDTLLWSFPGQTPSLSINVMDSVIYPTAGVFRTYLEVVGGGCSNYAVDSVDITVNPTPVPVITTTPSDTICSGNSVTLTATGGGTYTWTPGGPGASISPSPTSNTNYSVSTTVGGCTGEASQTIYVETAPTAAATHTSGTICVGSTVNFDGSTSSGANSYNWSFPAGSPASGSATGVLPNNSFGAAGTHAYSVTVTNTCGTDVFNGNVTITALPNVTASANPGITICQGDPVTLTGGGANTYVWNGGATNGVPFNPPSTFTYTVTGTNTTTGCADTAQITVHVNICTGIEDELNTNEFSIFPNPTSNIINLVGLEGATALTLLDVTGKVVYNTANITSTGMTIDLSNASNGLYFLQVQSADGIESYKVVKQ